MSDSLDDQDTCATPRSAIHIVWSCLFIIFTCTWTAIHPNIPPPHVSLKWWRILWWRVKIMLWALLVPEMMVGWATIQWSQARKMSAQASASAPKQRTREEVQDKSSQVVIPLATRIPSSSSYPSSLGTNDGVKPPEWKLAHSYFLLMGGFAVSGSTTNKPWTTIQYEDLLAGRYPWPRVDESDIMNVTKGEAVAKIIVVVQVIWFVSQLCGRRYADVEITELEIVTLAYALICTVLYLLWFRKPYNVRRPIFVGRSPTHPETISATYNDTVQRGEHRAGAWLWSLHDRLIGNSGFFSLPQGGSGLNPHNLSLFITATLFGAIHFMSWRYPYTWRPDADVWDIAALCVTLIPFMMFLLLALINTMSSNFLPREDAPTVLGRVLLSFATCLFYILTISYLIARVVLFIHSFVLVVQLSPSAKRTVPWLSFFPHL